MNNGFIIRAKLPSLNEYTAACRANKYEGAKFKRGIEDLIGWSIKASRTVKKPERAVILRIEWHERTKKRDADNIASAKKFILDALVKQGILENDSRRYVKGFVDLIVDDAEDFVVVEIKEIADGCGPPRKRGVNA